MFYLSKHVFIVTLVWLLHRLAKVFEHRLQQILRVRRMCSDETFRNFINTVMTYDYHDYIGQKINSKMCIEVTINNSNYHLIRI